MSYDVCGRGLLILCSQRFCFVCGGGVVSYDTWLDYYLAQNIYYLVSSTSSIHKMAYRQTLMYGIIRQMRASARNKYVYVWG